MNTKSKSQTNAQSAPASAPTQDAAADAQEQQSEMTQYHPAAFNAVQAVLWEYEANGLLDIKDNYHLSSAPLQIDIMVIKKKRGVKIEKVWAEAFRDDTLIEYKSPVANALSIGDFNKMRGYAYIYAEQKNIDVSGIAATLICHQKPTALFETLEAKKCYEILRKSSGIYYIMNKGVPAENALGFQIVVVPEEPDEDLAHILNGLDERYGMTDEEKFEILRNDKSGKLADSYWTKVAFKNFIKRRGIMTMWEMFEKEGIVAEHDRKVRQEGRQEGMQRGLETAFALFQKGYSLEDAKRQLQLA